MMMFVSTAIGFGYLLIGLIQAQTMSIKSHIQSHRNLLAASTLTFEGGPGNNQFVGNFYNGGAGGNLGIYVNNAFFAIDDDNGGSWPISNQPGPVTALYFLSADAYINVDNGFTSIGFYYSSGVTSGIYYELYSEVGAGGTKLLTSPTLPSNVVGAVNFIDWDATSSANFGVAKSVKFFNLLAEGSDRVLFDDIAFNAAPPTSSPTKAPTKAPTDAPTKAPTKTPSKAPTKAPTMAPTDAPTKAPTKAPSKAPSKAPTKAPTTAPSKAPTKSPTKAPSTTTTNAPSLTPSASPTISSDCGLFGFSFFCPRRTKCGFWERLFGIGDC